MIQKSKTIDFKAPSTLGRSQNVSQFFRSSKKVTQRRAFTLREPNIWLDEIFKGGKKSHKKGSHYSLGALPDYWGGSAGLSYHGCGARHTLSHATSSQRSHQRRTIPLFQTHTYHNFLPLIGRHFSRMNAKAINAAEHGSWMVYIIHKVLLSVFF